MITNCSKCSTLYEAGSDEQANEPGRTCHHCTAGIFDWTVKDLIDRIEKDQKPVSFYVQWLTNYVSVSPGAALYVLKNLPPDHRIRTQIVAGLVFMGWKS